jgi:hypothetical protein
MSALILPVRSRNVAALSKSAQVLCPSPDGHSNGDHAMNTNDILRWAHVAFLLPALLVGCTLPEEGPSSGSAATVERIEVVKRKPAFGGMRFGDVGEYEMVVAVAHAKVDPRHPANQRIAQTLP